MEHLSAIASLVILTGSLSFLCLLVLHFTNPELKPSWRMVSEYALGKHKWLLTLFFFFWGLSSLLAAWFYLGITNSGWATLGAILSAVTGIGAIMGGLFDVKHKLHGLSFTLGVPFFPVAVLLIAYHLRYQPGWQSHEQALMIGSHSVWVSLVLMVVTMILLFSGLKKAGIPVGPNQDPLTSIPKTVIGVNGYANRLLVIAYLAFNIIAAVIYLQINN